ncbi:unnamed protein product, partial [Polarella glacialis]
MNFPHMPPAPPHGFPQLPQKRPYDMPPEMLGGAASKMPNLGGLGAPFVGLQQQLGHPPAQQAGSFGWAGAPPLPMPPHLGLGGQPRPPYPGPPGGYPGTPAT